MKKFSIGRKIQYYRQEQKLTQQQLADRIGVTWEMISRYERDINQPFQKLNEISNALNVSINELLKEKENSEQEGYDIPLFTKVPEDLKFSIENTSFFYSCPKWMYKKDSDVFAIDGNLVDGVNSVYYVSPNTYPFRKHFVLCLKENKLVFDSFKNQKILIGVVFAKEEKFV